MYSRLHGYKATSEFLMANFTTHVDTDGVFATVVVGIGAIISRPILGGLYHRYCRI